MVLAIASGTLEMEEAASVDSIYGISFYRKVVPAV